jgi:hypothetical protein
MEKGSGHIMIATSLSMLITLTTNCIFELLKANHSIVQHITNHMHYFILTETDSFQYRTSKYFSNFNSYRLYNP